MSSPLRDDDVRRLLLWLAAIALIALAGVTVIGLATLARTAHVWTPYHGGR